MALAALTAACGSNAGSSSDSAGSSAATWKPTRGIHMDVPFAPGGGSDVFGRAMAQGFEKVRPGLNVTVQNRAGGSGAVGYAFLYSKKGDPYYILPSETTGVALPLFEKVPYTWQSFTPIMQVGADTNILIVPKGSKYASLSSVVDALKQSKHVKMGLTGSTSVDAIVTGLMEINQKVKFDRVIFQSGAEEVRGLLDGSIDMAMLNPSEVIGQIKAGSVHGIAVFADDRYTKAPLNDVPTAKEQGVDVSFVQFRGLFAAPDITDAQAKYWEETTKKWTESDGYQKYLDDNYLQKVVRPHDEFVTYLKQYEEKIKQVTAKTRK